MAERTIKAPTDADVTAIARMLIHADEICVEVASRRLDGTRNDLGLIQQVLDSGTKGREATYSLQALGMALGKVYVNDNPGFDWWMVEDEYGRDPAIRYRKTALLAHPRTMLSKRVEDGETVDVRELYDQLRFRLAELIRDGYGAA